MSKKKDIDEAIQQLHDEGWVIYRKTRVEDGVRVNIPNVRRSKKQAYSQQNIFA